MQHKNIVHVARVFLTEYLIGHWSDRFVQQLNVSLLIYESRCGSSDFFQLIYFYSLYNNNYEISTYRVHVLHYLTEPFVYLDITSL